MSAADRIARHATDLAEQHSELIAIGWLMGVLQQMDIHQLTPQQYVERYMEGKS